MGEARRRGPRVQRKLVAQQVNGLRWMCEVFGEEAGTRGWLHIQQAARRAYKFCDQEWYCLARAERMRGVGVALLAEGRLRR